jgi:transposase
MVVYEDFATGVVYRFLTNNFELPAITIAELYRERWSVELFFKWIKQHLKIKSFYGTSRNAVYSQIWIAICTFLLIAIAKKKYKIEQSLYAFSQTLGLTIFEKMPVNEIFIKNVKEQTSEDYPMLFNISDF